MTRSKATDLQREKKPGGITGKGFVKGDPRINRKGQLKPRAQRELEALLDEIFDEELLVTSNDGKQEKMTELKAALKRLLRSKNIGGAIYTIDKRFGRTTEKIEHTGKDGEPLLDENGIYNRVMERVSARLAGGESPRPKKNTG